MDKTVGLSLLALTLEGSAFGVKLDSSGRSANQGVNMKGGQNLATLQQRKKEEEAWVLARPCCICNKVIQGAYGFHEDGWTCSGKCEREYDLRPRYPGHTEEQFFERQT